ncbi:MAG: hypothetical protein ACTSR0_06095 [Candidatus Asgardarchaeia archaeon]
MGNFPRREEEVGRDVPRKLLNKRFDMVKKALKVAGRGKEIRIFERSRERSFKADFDFV